MHTQRFIKCKFTIARICKWKKRKSDFKRSTNSNGTFVSSVYTIFFNFFFYFCSFTATKNFIHICSYTICRRIENLIACNQICVCQTHYKTSITYACKTQFNWNIFPYSCSLYIERESDYKQKLENQPEKEEHDLRFSFGEYCSEKRENINILS